MIANYEIKFHQIQEIEIGYYNFCTFKNYL